MRKCLMVFFVALPLFLIAMNPAKQRYGDRILVQMSEEFLAEHSLPDEMYASATRFGEQGLDAVFDRYNGSEVIRAHRRIKDSAWEAKTGLHRWFIVKFGKEVDVEQVCTAFLAHPEVERAKALTLGEFQLVPNDPLYPQNWGHNNTAQFPSYQDGSFTGPAVGIVGFDSDAQPAWDQPQGMGLASVVIAIIDSGVDTGHPDLRLVAGYDTADNDSNPNPGSSGLSYGHGTCCAGITAARGNNAIGVTGIAPGCSVMPIKISFSSNNLFDEVTTTNGITWAVDHGADVLSMSFSFGLLDYGDNSAFDAALEYARNSGATLFASTGNGNAAAINYPAEHPSVISVGAASPGAERKSPTSVDGAGWGSNYGSDLQDDRLAVDICAPTYLPTTDIQGSTGYDPGSYYSYFGGTSCSSPYAAGVAALLKSRNSALTPSQIEQALKATATDMVIDGGWGWDAYTGHGMVNANSALLWNGTYHAACQITNPTDNSVVIEGTSVQVSVSAPGAGVTVRVEFYVDNDPTPIHTDSSSPYQWNIGSASFGTGSYIITAVAFYTNGSRSFDQINLTYVASDVSYWTGQNSTVWTNAANWAGNNLPSSSRDVVIPGATPYAPVVNIAGAICRNLMMYENSTLRLSGQNLNVLGSATLAGYVNFTGTAAFVVSGDLILQAGAGTNASADTHSFSVYGSVEFQEDAAFDMTGGNFKIYGSGNKSLTVDAPLIRLQNLYVSRGTGSLNLDVGVGAELVLTGTTNVAAGTVYIYAGGTLRQKGNLSVGGSLKMESGAMTFDGTNSVVTLGADSYLNNVILTGGPTLSLSSNLTVKGNFSFGSGNLIAANRTLYLGGHFSLDTAGQFTSTGSTVVFNGEGDQVLGNCSFNILRLDKPSGHLVIPQTRTVSAASYDWEAGTVKVTGGTFTVNDLADNNIKGAYIISSGTVNLSQDSYYFVDLDASLSISGGTLNVYGGMPGIASEWAYTKAVTVTMSAGTLDFKNNGILISNTGYALTANITGGIIRSSGNFGIERSGFSLGTGILELYGSTATALSMVPTSSVHKLSVAKTATLNLDGPISVNNSVTVTSGILNIAGAQLTVGTNLIVNSGLTMSNPAGSILVTGNVSTGAGCSCSLSAGVIEVLGAWTSPAGAIWQFGTGHTVIFSGNGDSILTLGEPGSGFGNLVFDKTSGQVLTSTETETFLNVSGNLSIGASAVFVQNAGTTNISGALDLDGTFQTGAACTLNLGSLQLDGLMNLGTGSVNVAAGYAQGTAGILNLNGGNMNLNAAYSGAMYAFSGAINLSSGTLQITNNGIQFPSTSQISFGGGTLKVGWSLTASIANSFQLTQGAVEFIGARFATIELGSGNHFHDLIVNKPSSSYQVMLMSNLSVNNDLIIQGGELAVSGRTLTVNRDVIINGGRLNASNSSGSLIVNRHWQNNVGATAFAEGQGTVSFVSGQNSILSSETFNHLVWNKPVSQSMVLNVPAGTTVTVNGTASGISGCLMVAGGGILDVNGNISLALNAGLNISPFEGVATLRLAGNLTDANPVLGWETSFVSNQNSLMILDGSGDQHLNPSYAMLQLRDLRVQKPSGTAYYSKSFYAINSLELISGTWAASETGLSSVLSGSLSVSAAGIITDPSGTYTLVAPSGNTVSILGSAQIGTLTVDLELPAGVLALNGNCLFAGTTVLNLSSGILNLGAHTLRLGGSLNIQADGRLEGGPGSRLELRDGSTLNVQSGGELYLLGSEASNATLSSPDGYYTLAMASLSIIGARYCVFERMGVNGINLGNRVAIDPAYPLENCTWRDGYPGGVLLRKASTQFVTIPNAHFPANTWGSAYNVQHTSAMGSITFVNAWGDFAGETFENDYNDSRIFWQYTAPDAPLNPRVSLVGGLLMLEWDAVTGASSYNIYQSTSPYPADWGAPVYNTTDLFYTAAPSEERAFYMVTSVY